MVKKNIIEYVESCDKIPTFKEIQKNCDITSLTVKEKYYLILNYIENYQKSGICPSVNEIAKYMGWKNENAVNHHFIYLVGNKFLDKQCGSKRKTIIINKNWREDIKNIEIKRKTYKKLKNK